MRIAGHSSGAARERRLGTVLPVSRTLQMELVDVKTVMELLLRAAVHVFRSVLG